MKYPHLVRVIMEDEKGKEFDIYFSGIAGEKCTYQISEAGVEKAVPTQNSTISILMSRRRTRSIFRSR